MRDLDEIRHVLDLARQGGFGEVEAEVGDLSFRASLGQSTAPASTECTALVDFEHSLPAERTEVIEAPCVGYFEPDGLEIGVGSSISAGDVVALISALGLKNDVEAKVSGEVCEVLVQPKQAVQYGQPLYRVKVKA